MGNLQINIPEGHIVDLEKSNLELGAIYFKEVKKVVTYEDVAKELFSESPGYGIVSRFSLGSSIQPFDMATKSYADKHVLYSTSEKQLESILALNKLCNVAKYLNGDWLPKFISTEESFCVRVSSGKVYITAHTFCNEGNVFFKSEKLANQAIDILGKEEIIKALTLNH